MERKQTHLKYALFTGIAIIIVELILHVAKLSFAPWAQYVMYIPLLIGLILNAQAYAKANNNYVTFGNIFGSCFKACAVVTLIMIVWSVLSIFIFPGMREKGMEIAQKSMTDRGMSDEQIDTAMQMTNKYFYHFMIGAIVFGFMLWGAILSLIAAAIPKKLGQQQPFDNNPSQQQFQ